MVSHLSLGYEIFCNLASGGLAVALAEQEFEAHGLHVRTSTFHLYCIVPPRETSHKV